MRTPRYHHALWLLSQDWRPADDVGAVDELVRRGLAEAHRSYRLTTAGILQLRKWMQSGDGHLPALLEQTLARYTGDWKTVRDPDYYTLELCRIGLLQWRWRFPFRRQFRLTQAGARRMEALNDW